MRAVLQLLQHQNFCKVALVLESGEPFEVAHHAAQTQHFAMFAQGFSPFCKSGECACFSGLCVNVYCMHRHVHPSCICDPCA